MEAKLGKELLDGSIREVIVMVGVHFLPAKKSVDESLQRRPVHGCQNQLARIIHELCQARKKPPRIPHMLDDLSGENDVEFKVPQLGKGAFNVSQNEVLDPPMLQKFDAIFRAIEPPKLILTRHLAKLKVQEILAPHVRVGRVSAAQVQNLSSLTEAKDLGNPRDNFRFSYRESGSCLHQKRFQFIKDSHASTDQEREPPGGDRPKLT